MEGWIKFHRSITKWQWYTSGKHIRLFMHLLVTANHKDGMWRGQKVFAGQTLTGRKTLALETGLSEQNVRTVLSDLESTSEITITKYTKYSVITITNWCQYQSTNQQSNQESTSNQPASNQQVTTNKNVNNKKNEKKERSGVFDFEEIYKAYPRKAGKTRGMISCKSKIKSQKKFDLFKKAVFNYSNSVAGQDPKYIKQFSSFMSCWEDFIEIDTTEASPRPCRASIFAAIGSGMDSLKDLHTLTDLKLSEADLEFIRNNGGLRQLSKMKEYDINKLF